MRVLMRLSKDALEVIRTAFVSAPNMEIDIYDFVALVQQCVFVLHRVFSLARCCYFTSMFLIVSQKPDFHAGRLLD